MLKFFSMIVVLLCCHVNLWGTSIRGFIENKNQWPVSVDYMASVPGGYMAVQAGQFNYFFLDYEKINKAHTLRHSSKDPLKTPSEENLWVDARTVQINFLNSNARALSVPSKKSTTYFNYFLGNDPQHWGSKAYAFEEVLYKDLYPGINLSIQAFGEQIKYDLILAPGSNPDYIHIEYAGAASLSLLKGDLIVNATPARIVEKKPLAYQTIDGMKKYVPCHYALTDNKLSFVFPEGYNTQYELVIDPILIFSTYSGFTADNWGSSATPGERGTVYSSGVTNLNGGGMFSATPGAFQTMYGGGYDIGIYKYDSLGKTLLYASYLGGKSADSPHSLLMNNNQELLILGTTSSDNFPTTTEAFDQSFSGGNEYSNLSVFPYSNGSDIFISKISADGSTLLASTLLGGSGNDGLGYTPLSVNYGDELRGDIIVDQQDNVYISSVTSSTNFPVANSFETTYRGGTTDALIAKLSGDLQQVLWAAFLGGSGMDAAYSIKFGVTEDTLFVAGGTTSPNFPTTPGSYQPNYRGQVFGHRGQVDGWIAKLNSDGSAIRAATYIGTSKYDQVYFLDTNTQGGVYVYGQTSGDFPVTSGVYSNPDAGQFLQHLSGDLTSMVFSTVFGASSSSGFLYGFNISPTAFLVNDQCGNIYMTGWGGTANGGGSSGTTFGMPITADAYQSTTAGSDFYFIVLSDDATKLLYATYMGGGTSATHVDGGTSRFDKNGIVYHAVCAGCATGFRTSTSDFPTTPGVWSRQNRSNNCNNAVFKFDLSTLRAVMETNSVDLQQPGLSMVCFPNNKIVFQNKSNGGQVYEWDFGDGTTETRSDKDDIIHEYTTLGTYRVRLKAVDSGSCIGEDSDFTTVKVAKATGFVGNDRTVCEGSSISLQAGGGVSYQWTTADRDVFSSSAEPVVSPLQDTLYIATVTDAEGCSISDTVKVNVIPKVDLQFTVSKESDCNSRPRIKLTNLTEDTEAIRIDFGDGNSSSLREVVHDYNKDGLYRIELTGQRSSCTYTKSEEVSVFTIKIPNVITPGVDEGLNDTFKVLYGEKLASEAGINVSVSFYNRWGKPVFQQTSYQDNWSAKELSAGTYYYEVEINNDISCTGWVKVIK